MPHLYLNLWCCTCLSNDLHLPCEFKSVYFSFWLLCFICAFALAFLCLLMSFCISFSGRWTDFELDWTVFWRKPAFDVWVCLPPIIYSTAPVLLLTAMSIWFFHQHDEWVWEPLSSGEADDHCPNDDPVINRIMILELQRGSSLSCKPGTVVSWPVHCGYQKTTSLGQLTFFSPWHLNTLDFSFTKIAGTIFVFSLKHPPLLPLALPLNQLLLYLIRRFTSLSS